MDLHQLTEEVKELALEAGAYIRKERLSFTKDAIEQKGVHDYVSYVDKTSERMIVERLKQLLPDAGFITEESGSDFSGQKYCWVVDPLDGTTNFIHDNAPYCVSIALRDKDRILLGVVYECVRNELFWANIESAAYLNGKEIHVSGQDTLDQSFIELGLPYNADVFRPFILKLLESLYGHVGGVRIMGAAAAELCYIAAGRFEARIEGLLGPWDIAAGNIILKQAGGIMTDFDGNPDCYDAKEVFASNGKIHDELLILLRKYKKIMNL